MVPTKSPKASLRCCRRASWLTPARHCSTKDSDTLTDADGLPVKIVITPGQTHDIKAAAELLADIRHGQMVLADRAYDADWLRAMVAGGGGWANIPPKRNRRDPVCFSPWF